LVDGAIIDIKVVVPLRDDQTEFGTRIGFLKKKDL